jgi:hypothetical protein
VIYETVGTAGYLSDLNHGNHKAAPNGTLEFTQPGDIVKKLVKDRTFNTNTIPETVKMLFAVTADHQPTMASVLATEGFKPVKGHSDVLNPNSANNITLWRYDYKTK